MRIIPHHEAARIVLALLDAGAEGADTLAAYVDQQMTIGEWTERQLVDAALRRSDQCVRLVEALVDRVSRLEGR